MVNLAPEVPAVAGAHGVQLPQRLEDGLVRRAANSNLQGPYIPSSHTGAYQPNSNLLQEALPTSQNSALSDSAMNVTIFQAHGASRRVRHVATAPIAPAQVSEGVTSAASVTA